jgi:hypothetical protein
LKRNKTIPLLDLHSSPTSSTRHIHPVARRPRLLPLTPLGSDGALCQMIVSLHHHGHIDPSSFGRPLSLSQAFSIITDHRPTSVLIPLCLATSLSQNHYSLSTRSTSQADDEVMTSEGHRLTTRGAQLQASEACRPSAYKRAEDLEANGGGGGGRRVVRPGAVLCLAVCSEPPDCFSWQVASRVLQQHC